MSSVTHYLDWRPRASHAIDPASFGFDSANLVANVAKHAEAHNFFPDIISQLIEKIDVHCRTDGLFIFAVTWKGDRPEHQLEFNLASLIADRIRLELNCPSVLRGSQVLRIGSWEAIHRTPTRIKLTDQQLGQSLEDLMRLDENVLKLMTDTLPFADARAVRPSSTPAVLRLRDMFTKTFDKTFQKIQEARERSFLGLGLSQRSWFFGVVYALLIFLIAIHAVNARGHSDLYLYVILAGAVNTAIAWLFVSKGVHKALAYFAKLNVRERLKRWMAGTRDISPSLKAMVYFYSSPRVRILTVPEIKVATVVLGPLLFSLSEVPSLLELAKLLRLNVQWSEKLEGALQIVSARKALASDGFWLEVILTFAFYLPLLICFYFILEVVVKRRRILRMLRQLRRTLLIGNVYNAVVEGIYLRTSRSNHKHYDFQSALALIASKYDEQILRRRRDVIVMSALVALSVWICWNQYWELVQRIF